MQTKTIEKLMTYERNDAGELTIIRIKPKDSTLGLIPVRANGSARMVQSAVYASLDLLRHKMYDHEFTQEGLHFYTPNGLANQFANENVGAVSVNYEGTRTFPLEPTLELYNYGWAVVGVMNRIYSLSSADNEESFARKHNFVDALILGHGLEIFIPAYLARAKGEQLSPWAEVMLGQWLETNDQVALKDRNERIARMFDNKYLAKPFVAAAKNGGKLQAQDVGSINGQTLMSMNDGQEIPLGELEMKRYLILNGTRVVRSLHWDGDIRKKAILAQAVKRQWTLMPKE